MHVLSDSADAGGGRGGVAVELQDQGPGSAAPTLPTLFLLLSRSRGNDGQVKAAEKKPRVHQEDNFCFK